MKFLKVLFVSCVVILCNLTLFAQQEVPTSWLFKAVKINDSVAELQLHATIKPNWHLYAQSNKCIEIPVSFTFKETGQFKLLGKVKEPKPQEEKDEMMSGTDRFFTKSVTFKQRVQILDNKPFVITGKVEGQACIEGRCTPIEQKCTFNISGFDKVKKNLAVVNTDTVKKVKPNQTKVEHSTTVKPAVVKNDGSKSGNKQESMLKYFLIAVLGGLAGLVMPCVFPMIPMTVSFFSKEGHKGKRDALLYGFFIVFIFVFFGLILSLIFGADLGNVLSTHWIPNLLFAAIFLVFAVSLLGYFEITLPSSWVNGSAKRQQAGGILGIFFMALTLVLVSFSCTLPIAGAVALNAAGGSFVKPIIGMLGFSLGIAVPFTLFALFPNFLKKMPKSGNWMNTLKVILAFVELAFALKFINVPDQTYHWGILDREVYLAFWIVLFSMLGLYLMGKIRFPLDEEYPVQKSWFRFTLSIFTFAFVVYMIPGMFGAPLKAISGWLPPMDTQDFDITAIVRDESGNGSENKNTYQLAEKPMYADQGLKIPHGIKGYFDYDQALRVAKAQNKPVFLDFTGHGCTNCRNVEATVWVDQQVRKLFANDLIVTTLYADDKIIKLPEAESGKIKNAEGEPITTLGAKNRWIENTIYKENSQPCYFIVDTDGSVLAGPVYFERNVDKYLKFLHQGIDAYNAKHNK